jgi:glycosyltransferase involved in cell wall biosynthesis
MIKLAIVIPTFNRVNSLSKTLEKFLFEIERLPQEIKGNVKILVSNNASTDDTKKTLQKYDGVKYLKYWNQEKNIGLDGNIFFLYKNSESDYVWIFSDDDIVFDGAIEKIYSALNQFKPSALLFSFVQPVDSKVKLFNYPEERKIISNLEDCINCLTLYPKISIYIYRKLELNAVEELNLEKYWHTNFGFIALGFSILGGVKNPEICVLSEALAGCDDNFNKIRFSPQTWGSFWEIFRHPFIAKNFPAMLDAQKKASYYNQIQALFAVKLGLLVPENMKDYDAFIKKFPFNLTYLIQNPRHFGQLIFMKLHIVWFWRKYFSKMKYV